MGRATGSLSTSKVVDRAGCQIAVVIGGGNIFRGLAGAAKGMDRATADYMGMLATVMNALAFQNALEQADVRCARPVRYPDADRVRVLCAPKALHHLEQGRVVIFAAGTGNPFFTTDTTAALRAIEMDCDVLAKATQVDGVYSADPKKDPARTRYDRLTYGEVLARNLKVMDGAAIALARDNNLPVIVFSIEEAGNLLKVLAGRGAGTVDRESEHGVDADVSSTARGMSLAGTQRTIVRQRLQAHGSREAAMAAATFDIKDLERRMRGVLDTAEAGICGLAHRPRLGEPARPGRGHGLRRQDAAQPGGDRARPMPRTISVQVWDKSQVRPSTRPSARPTSA